MGPTRMGHPDPLLLHSYADGQLTAPEARELELHLRVCDPCRQQFSALRELTSQIAALPDAPLARDLSQAVLASLRRRPTGLLRWTAALELAAGLGIAAMAWPSAEGSARALQALIQTTALAAAHWALWTWNSALEPILASAHQALQFDLTRILLPLGQSQVALLVTGGAVLWVAGNFVLLRQRAAEGRSR